MDFGLIRLICVIYSYVSLEINIIVVNMMKYGARFPIFESFIYHVLTEKP